MVVVVFDSRKVFTLKVVDSSWLWHEARVTNNLKPDAVSLIGLEIISWHEEVYGKSILASPENPGKEYKNFTYQHDQEFARPPVVAGKQTPSSHANYSQCTQRPWTASPGIFWENSRHFATPPLVSPRNDVWETSAEIPYWRRVTTQIWVVLLTGWSKFPKPQAVRPIRSTTQYWVVTSHQYGISALVSQMSFRGETSGGVVKCRLFSQARLGTELKPVFSP